MDPHLDTEHTIAARENPRQCGSKNIYSGTGESKPKVSKTTTKGITNDLYDGYNLISARVENNMHSNKPFVLLYSSIHFQLHPEQLQLQLEKQISLQLTCQSSHPLL